ncbi:MAG: dehydrogenase [Chromatiales bacterium]|nr:dehydrogenase [Chromatiales bacterium]
MSARAFWVTTPGRGEIRDEVLPTPGADEVEVRALASGISRGTETLVFRGEVPPSEHQRMRAPFQCGEFPAPVKYGYASVGMVEDGPPALRGRAVFCLHPHQTRYVVPASAVLPLPDDLPPGRAVLAANLETAINGLWDGGPRVGDRISVVGAGTVGCLVGWLAGRIPGCEVTLVDVEPARAEVARALGLRFATPDTAPGEADLVVHASGAPEGLVTALGLAGLEATVLEMSWFGSREVTLPLGAAFHARRLTLRASQVGQVAGARRARWSHRRRLALALDLLGDPALDAVVTDECTFEALPRTMALLASPGAASSTLTTRVCY